MENNLINNNNVIILDEYIDVRLNSKNKEWYTNKGYTWTKSGDTIRVKVKDLSPKSENIIKVICPKCQREHYTLWKSVYNTHDTLCHECNKQRPNILKCQFCGELTNRKYNNLGICNRHRYQINRYGETIQGRYDDNNIFIDYKNNLAKIELEYKRNPVIKKYALIDIEDIEKVKEYFWHLEKFNDDLFYVACSNNGKTLRLHTLIMNTPKGYVIDHINHNGLDNRKCNLRICTIQENSMNTRNRKNKYYSNIKGITYNKKSNVWESYITYKNINISLLQNKDINKVVFSRYYAEKLLFKDFSSIEYESIKDYIDNCLDKEKIKNKVKQRIKEKLNI